MARVGATQETMSETETETESESSVEMTKKKEGLQWLEKLSDVPMGKLPSHLEFQRTRVECKADAPIYVK